MVRDRGRGGGVDGGGMFGPSRSPRTDRGGGAPVDLSGSPDL